MLFAEIILLLLQGEYQLSKDKNDVSYHLCHTELLLIWEITSLREGHFDNKTSSTEEHLDDIILPHDNLSRHIVG